jgi:hypothetical protein
VSSEDRIQKSKRDTMSCSNTVSDVVEWNLVHRSRVEKKCDERILSREWGMLSYEAGWTNRSIVFSITFSATNFEHRQEQKTQSYSRNDGKEKQ